MRWLITLGLLACLNACSCGTGVCTAGGAGPGGFGGTGGGVALDAVIPLVGQVATVDVSTSPRFSSCGGAPLKATSVQLQVLDPGNLEVAAQVSAPATGSDGNVHATVTFTPAAPGPYHVTARFEPDLGIDQHDLQVAVDKRSGGTTVTLDTPCDLVDFDGDTVLCQQGNTLHTLRGGTTVTTAQVDTFAVAEGRVWTWSSLGGQLSVFGLGSDGTLQPIASRALTPSASVHLLANASDALVLDANAFTPARLDPDGGLELLASVPLPDDATYAQWVPGVGLETLGAASGVRCDWPLGSGAADGGCGSDVLNPLGGDDDGVWWFAADPMLPSSYVVSVSGWRTGQPRPALGTLSWASSQSVSAHPLDSPTSSPFLYAGGPLGTPSRLYLPRFTQAGLYLEQYTLVDPASVHGADTRHVWTMSGTMLTWWAR